jgi:hypothetical protein
MTQFGQVLLNNIPSRGVRKALKRSSDCIVRLRSGGAGRIRITQRAQRTQSKRSIQIIQITQGAATKKYFLRALCALCVIIIYASVSASAEPLRKSLVWYQLATPAM